MNIEAFDDDQRFAGFVSDLGRELEDFGAPLELVIARAEERVRRRRRWGVCIVGGCSVLVVGAGIVVATTAVTHQRRAAIYVRAEPSSSRPGLPATKPRLNNIVVGSPAQVTRVVTPTGWITRNDVTSQVPTADSRHITDRDIRYAPKGQLNKQDIELDLQTGDVSPPAIDALSGLEPTAHVSTVTRPGASPLILERDSADAGGLTIYEWYENRALVQVIARGSDEPVLPFIEGLRFTT